MSRIKNKTKEKLLFKRELINNYFSEVKHINPRNRQDLQDYFYFREGFEACYKHLTGKKLTCLG